EEMASATCMASSRVGASTRPWTSRTDGSTAASSGSPNAAVLPVPVCATPITSRPSSNEGIACSWIGEGEVNPSASTALRSASGRARASKPFRAAGAASAGPVGVSGLCGSAVSGAGARSVMTSFSGGEKVPALVAGQGPFRKRQERSGNRPARPQVGQELSLRSRSRLRQGHGGEIAHPARQAAPLAHRAPRTAHPPPRKGILVLRTHLAGELRSEHIGQTVTLTGWIGRRRDHGGVTFLDLRDASGVAQVVVREDEAMHLRNEYVLKVVGTVDQRPEGNENPMLDTGEIEVTATEVEVLSAAAPLPFQLDEHTEVGEETRLRYRYLDLRRQGPARALRLRSDANRAARETLLDEGFVEVETPTLTRSTPEGARDFLVPARLAPGSWYALPQSPQLFKQLLMVGGVEKYFQLARCYRDEDFRADRQPEFSQLDVELAFA